MSDAKKLTVTERALIRTVLHQIDESADLDEAASAASWEHGFGIILSREEAEYLLSLIPGAEDVTL